MNEKYKLYNLNSQDFEDVCCDILKIKTNKNFRCYAASKDGGIAMSAIFYNNVIDELQEEDKRYKDWFNYSYSKQCYYGDVIYTKFNEWINNGMKG